MRLRGITMEDFVNYKEPSMFLVTTMCNWKCCKEASIPISVCQNSKMVQELIRDFPNNYIYNSYIKNKITRAIVIGGLEPMLQFDEIIPFIKTFRDKDCLDTIVIYTGYNENEITDKINELKKFKNIIIKFGRYIPDSEPIFDKILGVTLASNNQYAKKIS